VRLVEGREGQGQGFWKGLGLQSIIKGQGYRAKRGLGLSSIVMVRVVEHSKGKGHRF